MASSMKELAIEVCELQKSYSSKNTSEMKRRGQLVRTEIPAWLQGRLPSLQKILGVVGHDLYAEGRDGTGRKTVVPWVRFASQSRSPGAQQGWYCVYLFAPDGTGFYLALSHGSTTLVDGEYRTKPDEEIDGFMSWARQALADEILGRPALTEPISLESDRTHLGSAYAKTTLLAKWYDRQDLPADGSFLRDAEEFSAYLKKLYMAEDLGLAPDAEPPEVLATREAARLTGRSSRSTSQGRGLTFEERSAIELYAMSVAKRYLKSEGFKVKDVSTKESYDFRATRGGEVVFVEVKGTTSLGEKVVLTANEVALHTREHPDNALVLVHSIDLERHRKKPKASGGFLVVIRPWGIDQGALRPISYTYSLSPEILLSSRVGKVSN